MILVLDNYDSFTYNLVQLLGELGADLEVRRNDEITVDRVGALAPQAIVISPGPCTPAEAGISVDVVRRYGATIPTLGVCLGHQAVATAYGAHVVRARRMMHGKTSPVAHNSDALFRDVRSPMEVMRYHSLVVDPETLPAELEVVAWTDEEGWDDEIQGVRHRDHPVWGVQFHPESIGSADGRALLANFLGMIGGAA